MRKLVIALLFITFISCNKKNDYRINEKRAGLIKIGKSESAVDELIKDYDVKTFNGGHYYSRNRYKTVSDNGKDLLHLRFSGGVLDAIKVYDKRYITGHGVKIGNTAQKVIDKGVHIWDINFGEREGLRCKLVEKNAMNGKIKPLENLQFFFTRNIYVNGATRNIGSNAVLKFFVIGDYFDIKMDTLTNDERQSLTNHKRGEYADNQYVNKYYGFTMDVPEDWTFTDNYGSMEDLVNFFYLKDNNSIAMLSVYLQERTVSSDGKRFLDKIGMQGEIEQVKNYTNGNLYRKLVFSRNNSEHEVYYSIVANGNGLMVKGRWFDSTELAQIEKIVMSLNIIAR